MATSTMRLGLLLIFALAIIHISKAEPEKGDESQMEQKSEGNMMASSMEEVELRTIREAANNDKDIERRKKKKARKDRKSRRKSRKAAQKKKNGRRKKKGANKGRKSGRNSGKGVKKNKNGRRKKKGAKKDRKSGRKSGKGAKLRRKKNRSKKERKPKKSAKKSRKMKNRPKQNNKQNVNNLIAKLNRQTCDEAALCQKIKDYIKYSNQLRKVKRIVKSCETMEKKANKSATEFDATVAALDEVIASNAKRRLYIRWRRSQRSTDEVVAIRDNLKNCSVSAKAKCEKKVQPACLEIALLTECEAALQAWLNLFGPSKGSCLQANADCCACITALATVDAKCLDFDAKSTATVKSKKACTGSETGAFGFCRKQQQEASVKGPPAACGGSTVTKAPSAATTAKAGATTGAAAATTAAAAGATTAAGGATTAGDATTAASCPVKCGVKKQGTKIVGGTEATVNEYPWMAHLDMGCGGSIVADKWIVTAAHCFFHPNTGQQTITSANIAQYEIKIGEHDMSVASETSLTKTLSGDLLIIHPEYVHATNLNDIALVRVPVIDLKVYTPVCLPTQGANYDGKKAWVYGWGALQSQGASPDKLQELELTIVSDASAKQSYQNVNGRELSDAQLAAMVFAGGVEGKDGCQGDSGGPFTYGNPDNNGQHELVGAVSWGDGCAVAGLPGAYAEVSVYRTWIDDEIKKNGGATFTC